MSGPGNSSSQYTNEGLGDSTESSQYTESTVSRLPSHVQPQPRQTARILLEKRRQQELPKRTPIEQAYMKNSRKQVPYFPGRQPASSSIIETIKATHSNRVKQLENQVAEDQIKINEYVTELRTMKTQLKRLEMELKKYQGMAGNIPTFMRSQEEELRTIQHELKKAKLQNMRLGQNLASREDELKRVRQENNRWRRLEDTMQLEDREKLSEQNEELKHQIDRQNDKIKMLTRKGILEVKNLKYELAVERRKHRATRHSLADSVESAERLRSDLELKKKYITYNSMRFAAGGSQQGKRPPDGLESISLISLTSNRLQTPVKLDPELLRHYPKTPTDARRPASNANTPPSRGGMLSRRNSPVSRAERDRSDRVPKANARNALVKRATPSPLPKIDDDDDLSQRSDMSEEDMDVYSSSFGSQSNKGASPEPGDSRKSGPEFRRDDDDSEEDEDGGRTGLKNGVSLPNLAGAETNGGRFSRATREGNSRGERRVPVDEGQRGKNRSTEGGGDRRSGTPEGKGNVKVAVAAVRRSPALTRGQHMVRDYEEMEEKVRRERMRTEEIEAESEELLSLDAEIHQEMDQASKGKLLAALNAIEKGAEPVRISPAKKQATIFTATRSDRATRHDSDDNSAVRLDRDTEADELERPMNKSELIRELFGGVGDSPARNEMTFQRYGVADANNNNNNDEDGSETDALYRPAPRVSLTNWKH